MPGKWIPNKKKKKKITKKPAPEKLHYYVIYKPYKMLSQFTQDGNYDTLKSLHPFPKDVYSVGRLDTDSEGLLVMTNDGPFKSKLLEPKFGHRKQYWVQVEGRMTPEALKEMKEGVEITVNGRKYKTRPCKAGFLSEEQVSILPARFPPVRDDVEKTWIWIELREGKNRQVRKMTAKVNFPTLRLVRYALQDMTIDDMQPGEVKTVTKNWIYKKCGL